MVSHARYDAVATWYSDLVSGDVEPLRSLLRQLLGEGDGTDVCLDLGCGPGARAQALRDLGWRVVGMDLSRESLRIARGSGRLLPVACADAARLPTAERSLDAVVSIMTHTDVDDWAAMVAEVARVLRPGGTFVHVGVHPCFVGPFAQLREDGTRVIHDGYRETRLRFDGPGIGDGVRRRVGVRHRPLADLVNPVVAAGLALVRFHEGEEGTVPGLLSFRAVMPEAPAPTSPVRRPGGRAP